MYLIRYKEWLNHKNIDLKSKKILENMSDNEIEDCFYKDMEFGTGGIRGILGVGPNRLNIYNIRKVNAGFARYLLNEVENSKGKGVVIAYDNRHMSREFAKESANVLSGHGIKVYLFDELRPTPELSFAVRQLNAAGGIVITASHNPKEYNGYKLYNDKGCQLIPCESDMVLKYVNEAPNGLDVDFHANDNLIEKIGKAIDVRYNEMVEKISINKVSSDLEIVFSPQHGTSFKGLEYLLNSAGHKVILVEEQCSYDPDFSNTKSPNPEDIVAYDLGIEYAKKHNADIILTTDPDADRVGIACRDKDGNYVLINGNQMGALLLDYIVSNKTLDEAPYAVTTTVTSDLASKICKKHNIDLKLVHTGFKFIGDEINKRENTDDSFIFGYEESYGYLVSPEVRDKDALQAGYLIAEMAAFYKKNRISIIDKLDCIYEEYGYYKDELLNFKMAGKDGMDRIKSIMNDLRENPLSKIGHSRVIEVQDFKEEILGLPKANVIKYILEDESFVAFRPSGTEPKFKVYLCVKGENKNSAQDKVKTLKDQIKNNIIN